MLIRFLRDARAATAIEYCFIAGFVALAIVGGARLLGGNLSSQAFRPVANGLS